MMCASVVLPRPGGPNSSTWSSASPRLRAALDEDLELLAHLLLADVLGERRSGRSARSIASSCGEAGPCGDQAVGLDCHPGIL